MKIVLVKEPKLLSDEMYSRLGKAIKLQYKPIVGGSTKNSHRKNSSLDDTPHFHTESFSTRYRITRPTSSFGSVSRDSGFNNYRSVIDCVIYRNHKEDHQLLVNIIQSIN